MWFHAFFDTFLLLFCAYIIRILAKAVSTGVVRTRGFSSIREKEPFAYWAGIFAYFMGATGMLIALVADALHSFFRIYISN
jgi:hypothetical protein